MSGRLIQHQQCVNIPLSYIRNRQHTPSVHKKKATQHSKTVLNRLETSCIPSQKHAVPRRRVCNLTTWEAKHCETGWGKTEITALNRKIILKLDLPLINSEALPMISCSSAIIWSVLGRKVRRRDQAACHRLPSDRALPSPFTAALDALPTRSIFCLTDSHPNGRDCGQNKNKSTTKRAQSCK